MLCEVYVKITYKTTYLQHFEKFKNFFYRVEAVEKSFNFVGYYFQLNIKLLFRTVNEIMTILHGFISL